MKVFGGFWGQSTDYWVRLDDIAVRGCGGILAMRECRFITINISVDDSRTVGYDLPSNNHA
jgi:hypothetical protein